MLFRSAGRARMARHVLAGSLVLLLVAAGCGGDDEGDATTAPASTADAVKVAALLDLSSPSQIPGVREVAEATVKVINEDGGLNGHPIELEVVDTAADAAKAQTAAAGLKDVVAVLLASAPVETAISGTLSGLGVPVVGVGYNPGTWGGAVTAFGLSCAKSKDYCAKPNFFTTATTFDAVVAEQLVAAKLAGATVASTASCAEVDSCAAAEPVYNAVGKGLGLKMVPQVRISATAADYTSECVGFMQDDVDFIQISASGAAGKKLIQNCLDQGYDGVFGASAGTVTHDLLGAPGTLAGGLNAFPWFVDDKPVQRYRQRMDDAGVDKDLYSTPTSTAIYSSLLLLQRAIHDHADTSATLDAAAALAAMHQVKDEDLGGLIAPVTFTPDNLDRTRPCFWPYIKRPDGSLEAPLGGLKYECYPKAAS